MCGIPDLAATGLRGSRHYRLSCHCLLLFCGSPLSYICVQPTGALPYMVPCCSYGDPLCLVYRVYNI